MRARDLVVAGLLVPLLVLVGCSDAEPETGPVVSDPPAVSDAPTPTEMGEATQAPASREDEARELVSDWVAALNEAGRTGDVTELQSLSSDKCVQCFGIIHFIEKTHQAGGRITGGDWELLEFLSAKREQGRVILLASVDSSPQLVVDSPGAEPMSYDGGVSEKTFWVGRIDGAVRMLEMDQ